MTVKPGKSIAGSISVGVLAHDLPAARTPTVAVFERIWGRLGISAATLSLELGSQRRWYRLRVNCIRSGQT